MRVDYVGYVDARTGGKFMVTANQEGSEAHFKSCIIECAAEEILIALR